MSTTAQSTALSTFEGAAIRVQLDAMIKALTQVDDYAAEVDDKVTLRLIARLHEARAAAREIEDRDPALLLYKGVRLNK